MYAGHISFTNNKYLSKISNYLTMQLDLYKSCFLSNVYDVYFLLKRVCKG